MGVGTTTAGGKEFLRVSYRDERGKVRSKGGFKSRAEAKGWEKANAARVEARKVALKTNQTPAEAYSNLTGLSHGQAEAAMVADERSSAERNKRTLASWVDAYLAACEQGRDGREAVRPSSLRKYARDLAHALPRLGPRRVSNISRADMTELREELLQTRKPKPLSRRSVRATIMQLRSLFQWLIHEGAFVGMNPCEGVKVEVSKGQLQQAVGNEEIHTPAEMKSIRDLMDRWVENGRRLGGRTRAEQLVIDARNRAFVNLCTLAGLRNGEARGLQWKSLLFDANSIVIEQALDFATDEVGKPKSPRAYRTVPMASALRPSLLAWQSLSANHDDPHGFVFLNEGGNPVTYNHTRQAWNYIQKASRVSRRVGVHKMRHFFASLLIDGGQFDAEDITNLMGHESITTTERVYRHLLTRRRARMRGSALIDASIAASEGVTLASTSSPS